MNKCNHCPNESINVTGNLCSIHLDEYKAQRQFSYEQSIRNIRSEYRYYIPLRDLGVHYADWGPWRSYEAYLEPCNTLKEALENVTISETDQDGGELNTYGFSEASSEVQEVILMNLYRFSRPLTNDWGMIKNKLGIEFFRF